ncbi:hypothetical protein VQ02_34355 [Methylobacterium variabile]|jgi:hypothetical protein|uniref:Uncharacterized protein n=1 Tax=Methylobacterium variabile TaxID=298794 RepID=A0A0J6RWP1_9HYPH|nr:hypothetical protein [Methylobacterium variabile]KMO25794.1 hypothetical protein VQ02_34355 [Methylobacterium variabile]
MANQYPLEWTFRLHVNVSWIESFRQAMSSCDVAILDDRTDESPDNYFWSSPHLNGLTDPAEIGARAAAIKALYDGAMTVTMRDNYYPWRLELPIEESGVKHLHLRLKIPAQPFSPDWDNWKFQVHDCPFRHKVAMYLFLSHFDDTVKNILLFLGVNGTTWISLYAIKDFISQQGWNEAKIAEGAGVTNAAIKLFSYTANNFEAIGPFARHGAQGRIPPANPMTLEDATKIILDCTEAFFHERAQAVDLKARFEERKA